MEDNYGPDGLMGFKNCCPNDERTERLCLTRSLGESENGLVGLFSASPWAGLRKSMYVGVSGASQRVAVQSTDRHA